MEWLFDGIGTEIVSIIISLIIGAIGGGTVGYRVGVKRMAVQKQIAGVDSRQRQELEIGKNTFSNGSLKSKESMKQFQKAGKNAVQVQIGGISDDRR